MGCLRLEGKDTAVMGDAWGYHRDLGCAAFLRAIPGSAGVLGAECCASVQVTITAHSAPLPYKDAGFPHTLQKYPIFQ